MRLGIDLVAVDELDRLAARRWFTHYMYADLEVEQAAAFGAARRREFLAGRFAAKEAVLKVLGLGLFDGVRPRDIRIVRVPAGGNEVSLHDSAATAAARASVGGVTVSISHKRGFVTAVAAGW